MSYDNASLFYDYQAQPDYENEALDSMQHYHNSLGPHFLK